MLWASVEYDEDSLETCADKHRDGFREITDQSNLPVMPCM